ncbi:MAG: anti-sigma factor [bacterium]|nr:anti-sigma factor [bacterium]
MREISCDVIRDILPLYVSDIVSTDTGELVAEHLETCPDCRRELEMMRQAIVIPADTEAEPIQLLKKSLTRTKRRTAILAAFCTAAVLLAAGLFLILYRTPASSQNIETATEASGIGTYWMLNISSKDGAWLNADRECLRASEEEGDVYRVNVYETLLPIPAQSRLTLQLGRYWETEPPAGYDVTVILVFEDKEVTYSMRELGQEYWKIQTESEE